LTLQQGTRLKGRFYSKTHLHIRLLPPMPTSRCSIPEPWDRTPSIQPGHFSSRILSPSYQWSTPLSCWKSPV